jgi:hypothetical protein
MTYTLYDESKEDLPFPVEDTTDLLGHSLRKAWGVIARKPRRLGEMAMEAGAGAPHSRHVRSGGPGLEMPGVGRDSGSVSRLPHY